MKLCNLRGLYECALHILLICAVSELLPSTQQVSARNEDQREKSVLFGGKQLSCLDQSVLVSAKFKSLIRHCWVTK